MDIKFLKRVLWAILGTMTTQVVVGICLLWNDHFTIKGLSTDMAVMKPRVEQLWWQSESRKSRAQMGRMNEVAKENHE